MDEKTLNRRAILGGIAAAGAAGALGALASRDAAAQGAPAPDAGPSQAPTMTDVKGKVVYITGGSSGIGLGLAQVMHEAGARVVIGNLDEKQFPDALKKFPAGSSRIQTVVHNVMDKDGWLRTADLIEKIYGPVNILFNNAGVGLQQSASAGTLKDWEWGMGVNFWGPVYGVNTFVPRMLASKQGCHIVTTTSTSGIVPNNGAGIYTVSKFAAVALMEELRGELRATNIGTTCFVPGNTTTNIGQSEIASAGRTEERGGCGGARCRRRRRRARTRCGRTGTRSAGGGGRACFTLLGATAGSGRRGSRGARCHPAQRPVRRAAAGMGSGCRGARQCAARIHGPDHADAGFTEGPRLQPHPDLCAGNRASQGDAEPYHCRHLIPRSETMDELARSSRIPGQPHDIALRPESDAQAGSQVACRCNAQRCLTVAQHKTLS